MNIATVFLVILFYRISQLQAKISQLEYERDESLEQVGNLQAVKVDLEAKISQLEYERDESLEQVANLQAVKVDLEAKISQLEYERDESVKQVDSLKGVKADLEARIWQLEYKRDERVKRQNERDDADEITGTTMMSKAIQTAPGIFTEEPKIVSNTTGELTPVHPSALTLVTYKKGKARYVVNYKGKRTLMTRKEFRKKFPQKKPPTYTEESKARKSVGNIIRRRISQRFRDQKNDNKKRSDINLGRTRGKLPPIRKLRKTQTIENLMIFFIREYIEKGEDGLPVKMYNDPEETDDEYEEEVKEEYTRKPKDYELWLKKSIRSENSRQRKNVKEAPTETKRKSLRQQRERKNPGEEAAKNKRKSLHQQRMRKNPGEAAVENKRQSLHQQRKRKNPTEDAAENKRKSLRQRGKRKNPTQEATANNRKSLRQQRKRKIPQEEAVENKKRKSPSQAREKGNESETLSSDIAKSSKNFFTKDPEVVPVRVRNKRTATVVRPNQPTEENILDFSPPLRLRNKRTATEVRPNQPTEENIPDFSPPLRLRNKRTATEVRPNQPTEENIPDFCPPLRLRNKRTATVVRPNQPTEENIPDFSPPENSRLTVETPPSDNNWVTDFADHFQDPDKFSSLDYSTLTEGQNRTREQVKTPEPNNNWIKEEEEYPVEKVNFFDY